MVYVELDAAFRVACAVTGSETLANAIRRYMTPERLIDVVRCRECQNWETDWEPSPFNPDNPQHYCAVNDLFPNVDWFCKDGQRRKDGDK